MGDDFYSRGLNKNGANYTPLSPVAFLRRAADVHPKRVSLVSEGRRFTWEETRERCCLFAHALLKRGIKQNDTVRGFQPSGRIARNSEIILLLHVNVCFGRV